MLLGLDRQANLTDTLCPKSPTTKSVLPFPWQYLDSNGKSPHSPIDLDSLRAAIDSINATTAMPTYIPSLLIIPAASKSQTQKEC